MIVVQENGAKMEQLRDSIPPETRESLHDWRNRIGAHIDAESPWSELEAGIRQMDLAPICKLADHVLLWLEVAAAHPGGPVLLLLSARRMKRVVDAIPPVRQDCRTSTLTWMPAASRQRCRRRTWTQIT